MLGRGGGGPHSEAETEQPKVTELTLKQDYLPHATAKHSKALSFIHTASVRVISSLWHPVLSAATSGSLGRHRVRVVGSHRDKHCSVQGKKISLSN